MAKIGRPRTRDDNNPWVQLDRELALKEYYNNREYKLRYAAEYHKKNLEVLKYARAHNCSIPEARRRLEKEKWTYLWE